MLMARDPILIEQVKQAFGAQSYDLDGRLNRRYLAKHVFTDNEKVNALNQLVHPRVAEDARIWAEERAGEAPYLIREAALLFESGANKRVDKVIVVSAPLEMRVERVLKRDPQRSREEVLQIIDKQMPEAEKLKLADFVVENDEKSMILPKILALHQQFLQMAAQNKG
jgi:dephospho-CoA kinase